MMTRQDTRLPTTLLTGFLGSGKTTLLKRILEHPDMARTAVLINEFGEIGLDHLLVQAIQGDTLVLQNGCICCRLQGDLQTSLRNLIDGRGKEGAADFDRIVIETTGLADPAPILRTLHLDPMLKYQIRLSACVATVDAQHLAAQLDGHDEAANQIAAADRLVITKSDLVASAQMAGARARIAELNPTALVVDANDPGFDPAMLVGSLDMGGGEVRQWFKGIAAAGASAEGGHRAAEVQSFSLRIAEPVDWTAFGVWLTALLHRHGDRVLRVKGLLQVSDAEGPVVLHGVRNVIHQPVHLDAWPDEDRSTRLVFIARGLEIESVRRSLFIFLSAAQGSAVEVDAA
jgi:G3E family GTPase